MKLLRTALLPVAAALAIAPNALAASPKGYSGVHAGVQNAVAGATQSNGNLPFTGFDVTLMIVGVIVLVLVGAALRRFAGNHA